MEYHCSLYINTYNIINVSYVHKPQFTGPSIILRNVSSFNLN